MNKKKIIIISSTVIFILTLIVVAIFLLKKDKGNNVEIKETTNEYIAYIKINPLIKIEYKATCKGDICSEPIVTNYELVNDDAKDIYKDIDLIGTDKKLYEVISLISKTAKDNNIEFEEVEIYSNWENLNNYINNSNKEEYEWTYIINIRDKENLEDISSSLIENKKLYNVEFDTDGGNNINTQTIEEGKTAKEPTPPTKKGYKFKEWQLDDTKYDFDTEIKSDITLIAKWEKVETPKEDKTEENKDNPNSEEKEETTKEEEKKTKSVKMIFTNEMIELKNKSSKHQVTFPNTETKQITLTISGEEKTFNKYSQDELRNCKLYIDLSSLNTGTHNVKLQIENKKKDLTYELSSSNITIKIEEWEISSTIDKINLNDKLMVFKGYSGTACGFYFYSTNAKEVFGSRMEQNSINIEDYNATSKENLIYDTNAETNAINSLKKYENQKIKGISNYRASLDNHRLYYSYNYIYFLKDYNGLQDALENQSKSLTQTIDNSIKNGINVWGMCGDIGEELELDEELCNQYNLTCSRW